MFKRALLSLTRQKKKTMILLVAFIVLFGSLTLTTYLKNASEHSLLEVKKSFGPLVVIDLSVETHKSIDEIFRNPEAHGYKIIEGNGVSTLVPLEQLEEPKDLLKKHRPITESPYVRDYDYTYRLSLEGVGLNFYNFRMDNKEPLVDFQWIYLRSTRLPGGIDYESARASLVDGRLFTEDELSRNTNKCLISKELAELNGLVPGSRIELEYRPSFLEFYSETTIPLTLEVIGILDYKREFMNSKENINNLHQESIVLSEIGNTVLVSEEVVKDLYKKGVPFEEELSSPFGISTSKDILNPDRIFIILDDPDHLDAFIEENEGYLHEDFQFYHNFGQKYQLLSEPLQQMDKLFNRASLLISMATFVIIFFIVLLFLRDRKEELLILISLGEKKRRIILQLLIETLGILVISLLIALTVVYPVSIHLSDHFLSQAEDQMNQPIQEDMEYNVEMSTLREQMTTMTMEEVLESYEIKPSLGELIKLSFISILITMLATLCSSFFALRTKPLHLLSSISS